MLEEDPEKICHVEPWAHHPELAELVSESIQAMILSVSCKINAIQLFTPTPGYQRVINDAIKDSVRSSMVQRLQ